MTKKENQVIAAKGVIKKYLLRGVNDETAVELVNAILAAEDDPPEPEIKPGELVRGYSSEPWIGYIGILEHSDEEGCFAVNTGDNMPVFVKNIERFYMPFDWERWPSVAWVVDFDDTSRRTGRDNSCWKLGEKNICGARVVRILQRPEGR